MMSTPAVSSRPRSSGWKIARCDSGAQKSGAETSSPRNAGGITPMISNGSPRTSTVRPSTFGSRLNWRFQPWSLSTTTGLPPDSSSAGVSARPITGSTWTTWKKLPVTSDADIIRPSTRRSTSDTAA